MRSGEEREDRPEGLHQVSDQSDLTGLRKTYSKQYGDGPTDWRMDQRTDGPTHKVSYRVALPRLKI